MKLLFILIPIIAVGAYIGWLLFMGKEPKSDNGKFKFWNRVFFGVLLFIILMVVIFKNYVITA